jgi:type IV secretion system protein TrbL
MGGTGVIDNFLGVFTQYIDSGFGLVQGDVRWLASILIAIDITLAGLLWAMAPDEDVLARLIRKTLYIGVFAFIIGNYNNLAKIIYNSFAGLGVEASGGTVSAAQLLQPGRIAQVGVTAGQPILISISGLMGFASFFDNFVQIVILLIAWLIVIASFFVMAIQLFVSLIEFKLTTLAGFVLVPFGLFGRTAFLAEKVLGNVVSSGVKILVLAVIVGIGSTIFNQFTSGIGASPTINDALTLILAALTLLGMTIFGPGIANGLIAGGPQLGASAAVGTSLAVGGLGYAAASLAGSGAGAIGGAALRAGRGVVGAAGGAATAIRSIGTAEVAEEAAAAAASPLRGSSGATGSAAAQGSTGTGMSPSAPSLRASRNPPSRLRGSSACGAVRLSAVASPPPSTPFAPAIIQAQAAASISLRGISQCSDDRPCATDARPSLRRPTREPDKPGMSVSVRRASRPRIGGSLSLAR